MLWQEIVAWTGILYGALELMAIVAAIDAVMTSRTTQGSIAWAIALVTLPFVTLPLYLIFGRSKFEGYVSARRAGDLEINDIAGRLEKDLAGFLPAFDGAPEQIGVLEKLAELPFTRRNCADLLIDGEATFGEMFRVIDDARDYILIQFFIVHDDRLGRDLKEKLALKAEGF